MKINVTIWPNETWPVTWRDFYEGLVFRNPDPVAGARHAAHVQNSFTVGTRHAVSVTVDQPDLSPAANFMGMTQNTVFTAVEVRFIEPAGLMNQAPTIPHF
jgi:hypothetical protein